MEKERDKGWYLKIQQLEKKIKAVEGGITNIDAK
jgi:hypothetical protein